MMQHDRCPVTRELQTQCPAGVPWWQAERDAQAASQQQQVQSLATALTQARTPHPGPKSLSMPADEDRPCRVERQAALELAELLDRQPNVSATTGSGDPAAGTPGRRTAAGVCQPVRGPGRCCRARCARCHHADAPAAGWHVLALENALCCILCRMFSDHYLNLGTTPLCRHPHQELVWRRQ